MPTWNSNSVIAWLLARAGLSAETVRPPPGGRAPGWAAGVAVARCQQGLPQPAHERRLPDPGHEHDLRASAHAGSHGPA
jgi:hypothetical protein